jgi:hypothetical protein
MKLKSIWVATAVTVVAMMALLAGCSSENQSVRSSPFAQAYRRGQIYVVQRPLLLWSRPARRKALFSPLPSSHWSQYYLDFPGDLPFDPPTIDDWVKHPAAYSARIKGIVKPGVKIQALFLGTSNRSLAAGSYAYFEILDGTFGGFVVDGSLVSELGQPNGYAPHVDPRFLKPLQ